MAGTKARPRAKPTPPRTRDEVLADLRDVAGRIATTDEELKGLFTKRAALFHEGRATDPPVTHMAAAEAAGVSEPMVIKALRAPAPTT